MTPYRLIVDNQLNYGPAARRARVWERNPDDRVCVVTETPADTGTSITNAAEHVLDAVADEWGHGCAVVEHYTASAIDEEHFDVVTRDSTGMIRWERLDAAVLAKELPGLLETS